MKRAVLLTCAACVLLGLVSWRLMGAGIAAETEATGTAAKMESELGFYVEATEEGGAYLVSRRGIWYLQQATATEVRFRAADAKKLFKR